MENEDVVGAAPTGDAPTTSEWSTILLPTKVQLILETWLKLLSWCPILEVRSLQFVWRSSTHRSHLQGLEDRAPVDDIYGCLIFKWVVETCWWQDDKTVAPGKTAKWHVLMLCNLPVMLFAKFPFLVQYSPLSISANFAIPWYHGVVSAHKISLPNTLWSHYHTIFLSPCPSVCPSVHLSVDRIVSALYLQQYSSDPFHICTSYQATSEGV